MRRKNAFIPVFFEHCDSQRALHSFIETYERNREKQIKNRKYENVKMQTCDTNRRVRPLRRLRRWRLQLQAPLRRSYAREGDTMSANY